MTICKRCGGSDYNNSGHCRACKKINSERWKKDHPNYAKEWRENHRDKNKEYIKKWKSKNPDHHEKYYKANFEKLKAYNAEYHAKNPEVTRLKNHRRRARLAGNGGKLSKGITEKLYKLQQGKCACCKIKLKDYHLDHIMPIALGGTNTDDNIQLLCAACNHRKFAKHPIDFMQSQGFLL